jgi:2-polyprenyl-6-methoxyphenol hydroxylase-like FAD-dependent oxidoreductase
MIKKDVSNTNKPLVAALMHEASFDVILIGYGPVSQGLALMLGRQGRRVAVCERWRTRYPLPRAVCIDHELYRVLCANGLQDVLPRISHPGHRYQWFNAEWQELLVIDWSADSISGGTETNFVHQPTLEEALDRAVAAQHTVQTFLGWEAVSIEQDEKAASVRLRHTATGEEKELTARYVIGCDGANSLARKTIGCAQEDRGFEADWLVIDVLLKDGITIQGLGLPHAGQYCNPIRPTTIVPAGVRDGRIFRRWEFMRLPNESIAELEREERVWELLQPWAGPNDVELIRHKVYNFRSLLAERWRDRRLLIAGDAAHVMPPFMGQGMCSGLRDTWNLSWKLSLVLDGKAEDRLLDTYQVERMAHVSGLIDLSIYLGKIICISDLQKAAERDTAFLTGAAPLPPPFPWLVDGLLHRDPAGTASRGAGMLAPHTEIGDGDFVGRLDAFTGVGFVVILRGIPEEWLRNEQLAALKTLGACCVGLEADANGRGFRDLTGRLDGFLTAQQWEAMIVRPDFYIYGGVGQLASLPKLVDDFLAHLDRAGIHVASPPAVEEKCKVYATSVF